MRRASLETLGAERYDVLVVGGGVYGAMAARDAALRGLRTALIERGDFGGGASHASLKIVHGGIRYVQQLDLPRLRASAREREFWQRAARGLVRPLEFVAPLVGRGMKGPLAFAAAAAVYNLASADLRGAAYPRARVIAAAAARTKLGDLAADEATGAGLWRDGQILDANRLQLACVMAAAEAGADVANHVEATALLGPESRVEGVAARDGLRGAQAEIRADVTLSCTGAGAARFARLGAQRIATDRFPRFARAMNLVLDRRLCDIGVGLFSRGEPGAADRGGRMYFFTPWEGLTIVGTDQMPHEGDGDAWRPSDADVDRFLQRIEAARPGLGLTRADVIYRYGGLIPADVDDDRSTVRQRRRGALIDHGRADSVAGLVSVIGVKYTTARLIAARAIDLAAGSSDRRAAAASFETSLPDPGLARFDPDDAAALTARVRTAVRAEMALRLDDLLARRTRLAETGRLVGAGGEARLARAAETMAAELGWDRTRMAAEVDAVRAMF